MERIAYLHKKITIFCEYIGVKKSLPFLPKGRLFIFHCEYIIFFIESSYSNSALNSAPDFMDK